MIYSTHFNMFIKRFLNELEQTVKWSDMLGYVYWFAVLTTISCGCATGIYVTLINKSDMVTSCQEKYQFYENFITSNRIEMDQVPWMLIENGTIFTRNKQTSHSEIMDLAWRIGFLEQRIR